MTKHWTPAKGLTQYSYDNNGNTLSVAYSSGPGITATYDTLNRIASLTDAVGNSKFTYQNFGPFWSALASEDGPWLADTMSRTYYANGLPNAYALDGGWSGSYGYDAMLRLHTLSSPAGTFTYNYANATGRQIASLGLPGSSTIAYGYDAAGLLTSTALKDSGNHVLDSSAYTYDAVGWRTNVLRGDGTHVGYGYDSIGQLTSAQGFESGGTPRFNENFGYTYDPAGNLTQRVNDTLSQTFTVDPANELTNVLRTTTVMTVAGGLTNSPTSLSINGKTANIYSDKTFAATNVTLVNGLNTFTNILTISSTSYTNQLTKNLPLSANLSYDLNGNLTSDGLHGFEYDCANQLTRITQANKFKSEFVYDGFGRRRIRREYAWTGTWAPTSETHYVYDGMLVIQERDGNNATQVSYTRGVDLSGSRQGAGGIGGLLARTDANGSAFYHADGNGNVTAMINSSGTVLAKYLYDPYGNILNKSGSLADVNLYRFSSREEHIPSGVYYCDFRYYEPNSQRWLNRDPLEERGGLNLYSYTWNNPISFVDSDGRNVLGGLHGAQIGTTIGGWIGGLFGGGGGAVIGAGGGTLVEPGGGTIIGGGAGAVEGSITGIAIGEGIGGGLGAIIGDIITGPDPVMMAGKKDHLLPHSGTCPYVPKKQKGGGYPRNKRGDYIDDKGNEWRWDPKKQEWDVQHPDGSHTNVGPDGGITHGPNNF